MNLAQILQKTGDGHCQLESGAVTVNLAMTDDAEYWHLDDYAVSSRSGQLLVMVPKNLPKITHADNGWQHHYPRA